MPIIWAVMIYSQLILTMNLSKIKVLKNIK